MKTSDSNLQVAVLALERGLIDREQFVSACSSWATAGRGATLAELLVDRGWLSSNERQLLETLVERERIEHQPTLTIGRRGASPPAADVDADADVDVNLDVDLDVGLDALDDDGPLSMRERITLRGLHSSGGIGEVWRAFDHVLGREVALKRLKHEQAELHDNRARFRREAQITGQLDHPGVVPVYDYVSAEDGSRCFYTMRFLKGRTLAEVIHDFHAGRDEAVDDLVSSHFLQLLGYFVSICNTMAFAHDRGVVHRDLKGENVIIGDYGEVIVLDWGLAKRIDEWEATPTVASQPRVVIDEGGIVATMQGERLGTPSFMAPEQALGMIDRIDERTDVYGLAAILYNLLCGQLPFPGTDVTAIMRAVIQQPPKPPRELVAGVPAELEAICLRGLAKKREHRWQSVAALGAAVQGWVTALAERKRTEQERERFFDLSLDLLAVIDRHGRLQQSNAAWTSVLGWSEGDRAGAAWIEFVEPEHREWVEAKFAELWDGAEQVEFEVRMRRRDEAAPRWIDIRARTIPNEAGAYMVGRDVTARRQSEQQFIGLLESAPDATCVIDEHGVIVLVNAQLERMFGYAREQLVGQPIERLVPESLRGRHLEHVKRYVRDPQARPMGSGMALTGQRADGVIIPVEVSLSPVQTETRMLVSCALRSRDVATLMVGPQG